MFECLLQVFLDVAKKNIMRRPIHARIDLAALRHNHAVARKHAGDVSLWSVIKANAYGHGVLEIAQGLHFLICNMKAQVVLAQRSSRRVRIQCSM